MRILARALRAESHELPALAWAFAYFFLLLAAYYVLRPARDALAVEAGNENAADVTIELAEYTIEVDGVEVAVGVRSQLLVQGS